MLRCARCSSDHSQCSPENNHGWEKDPGLDVVQSKVTWYHPTARSNEQQFVISEALNSHDIPASKDGGYLGQLIALKIEVFFHARDIGLGQVGAVKVVEEIHEAAEGQNEEIDFANQFPLFSRFIRPQVGLER